MIKQTKTKIIKAGTGLATGILAAGITYIVMNKDDTAKIASTLAFGMGCVAGHDEVKRLLRKGKGDKD